MSAQSSDPRASQPASLKATLQEGADATAQILERLKAHGSRNTRYAQRGEVARGGMGLILRVWDEDLRRELAMKVVLGESGQATTGEIAPKMLGRFLEEAQVTGQLDHPGIVPVHELGLDERGAVFFTMRLVRGRDLKEVFERVHAGDREWTQTRVLWVLLKVCDAMAYAHSKGVIHRDLKPANVMVGRFGEVYVMDWGLARVLGQPDRHDLRLRNEPSGMTFVQSERRADASHSADSVLFTMDGDVVGTPAYMAPEQARGEMERLGPRSDVYALGALLYHLLTGEMPYVEPGARVSQHLVLRWVLEGPPRAPHVLRPEVPEELAAICEKAMAREPEQRYADMGALGEDLRAYLENRVVKAHKRGAWIEFQKWVQRNRALAVAWGAAALVALLGLAATAWVQVRGRRTAEAARARAEASELVAEQSLAEAQRQEAIARRERSNVLRLSAFQELEALEREADELWPAVPARIPAMEAWLARAAALVAGLEPGADGDPGHRAQLATLQARALPLAPEERARLVAAHPRGAELERIEREVTTLERAAAVRTGRAAPSAVEPELGAEPLEASALNERAFALVDPARTEFGREQEGLALARLALESAEPHERSFVLDTLAWAEFACGLDEQALASSRAALAEVPAGTEPLFEDYLARLAQAVEFARGARSDVPLEAARARALQLEREIFGSSLPRFENEEDRWWHQEVRKLVQAIEAFADEARGLMKGFSPAHGWGVARRLEFARAVALRSLESSDAQARWAAARLAVAAPGSPYGGLELVPQLGLVPLGTDPHSGLEEFADLATGTPPQRAADGRLELGPESAVVFVLLPGGQFELGAQADSANRRRHDPEADPSEGPPQMLTLAPFFFAKHEFAQGQWRRFTGRNPSKHLAGTVSAENPLDERSPVERVSWLEAERQCARLGWQLPTEAQWEYGARAGTESPWWTGAEPLSLNGAENLSDSFARDSGAPWTYFENELDDGWLVHAPVGSFEPNPFGLHDTLGNVYEWCRDAFGSFALPLAEGDGLRSGGNPGTRAVRGGSFITAARAARVSKRDSAPVELELDAIGLRPVRALER